MTPRFLISASLLLASLPAFSQVPGDIQLVPAFGGEFFSQPIGVRHAVDGSNRKFIIERAGRIILVDASDQVQATPFLDISSAVNTNTEGGFLGLAFHPEYSSNGRFFVKYTYDIPGGGVNLITRVSEFEVSADDADIANPGSERIILEIPQDSNNHNGGDLHFGADGYLYFGMGDGGGGNDPCERGQGLDPSATPGAGCAPGPRGWLHGKMLRIDIDSTTPAGANNLCAAAPDGSAEYAVPSDNPFQGEADRCGEVWAYGLRNPYRFSVDRETGDLWIGDVGQGTWEEIDHLPFGNSSGANLGWKICEGNFLRGSTTQACTLGDHVPPVITYPYSPSPCRSVTGGYRYRGPVISMQGYYVFSDYCAGDIRFASENARGTGWTVEQFGQSVSGPAGFGEDEQGNLYITQLGGQVLVFNGDTGPSDPVFEDRFEDNAP